MEPGVWLFLLYYAKLMYSPACIELFRSFFPYFLQEAPESWIEYYCAYPIGDDFYAWMSGFYNAVNVLDLGISLDDAVLSFGESSS
jgi:hypothetical protein